MWSQLYGCNQWNQQVTKSVNQAVKALKTINRWHNDMVMKWKTNGELRQRKIHYQASPSTIWEGIYNLGQTFET